MGYKLTANCDDRWDPILEIPLYESVPEPETAPLEEIRESGVTLYEKREYSNWTLLSSDRKVDPNSCTFMANGVDLTDPKHKQPFLLQFGFVQFVVTITEKNGSSKTLRSKYCNAFQTEEKENLQNMVSQILNIDDGDICDLLRWPSVQQEGRQSSKLEKYSMISGALQQTGGVDSSRLPLERVLDIYKRHGGYFKVRPEYTIRRTPVTTPFHRVKTLTSDSMLWSARTGNLRKVNSGGIQVGGQHYLPMETLSETAERDYHIYENRIILGFLDTVIRKIREKENLQDEHTEFDILRMIFYPEEAGWDKSGLDKVEQLRYQYQRSLRLEARKIPRVNSIPKQTKRFQEILPYREIYRCIYDWFRNGTSWDFGDGTVFRGNLADTVYEYFCWLQLLKLFYAKGFHRYQDSKRTNFGNDQKSKPPFSNVVYLEKQDTKTKITLYFNPTIMSLKPAAAADKCGLSLVRTTIEKKDPKDPGNHYAPDFVIRVEQNNHVEYAILDAKFRSIQNLCKSDLYDKKAFSTMEECLYKYYLSISDTDLGRPVRMMWLLQGRAEKTPEEDRRSCSAIEKPKIEENFEYLPKSFFNSLSMGILPLTSYNSKAAMERLWAEVKEIWNF